MPTYVYECSACARKWEAYNAIARRDREKCPKCKRKAVRIFVPPTAIRGDLKPYYSHSAGCFIESRAHQKRVLEQLGIRRAKEQPWMDSDAPFIIVDGELPMANIPEPVTMPGTVDAADATVSDPESDDLPTEIREVLERN